MKTQDLEVIREKFPEIVLQDKETGKTSCCGATATCCGDIDMADDYSRVVNAEKNKLYCSEPGSGCC